MRLLSPGKINLFLRVIRKREDGFHELASLFQAISLCDLIDIDLSDHDRLSCNDPAIPTDSSNTIWKAVTVFRNQTGFTTPLDIRLVKNIPSEAGLGGGSSNTAAVLWGLCALSKKTIPIEKLSSWGATVGSDVPFFFSEGTAYCTGRGEKIRKLPALPKTYLWIVHPKHKLSTPAVYKEYVPQQVPKRDPKEILQGFLKSEWSCFNDLETPAFSLVPELAKLKEQLLLSFPTVLMSGSGTSLFCIGEGSPPKIPEVAFSRVSTLNRKENNWYL